MKPAKLFTPAARLERALGLQRRVCASPPALPADVEDLHAQLRAQLLRAYRDGRLRGSPDEIWKKLRVDDPIEQKLYDRLKLDRAEFPPAHLAALFGGEKDSEKSEASKHFARDDGAWFDFSITMKRDKAGLRLIAYDFHIRFLDQLPPPFLRFDLNPPQHRREEEGMRSHIHPGCADTELSVPSPFMSPLEVLDLLIYGLRRPAKARAAELRE